MASLFSAQKPLTDVERKLLGAKVGALSSLQLMRRRDLLEQEQEAFGAGAAPEQQPGIFRRLIDILSRPNYAIAGFTQELMRGQSVTSAFGRAATEFFSGVAGLAGQKKAFGQVLEEAGFGTKTLADVFPVLDKTWLGRAGSRGAIGLGLDIITDPLTYIGAGPARAAYKLLSKAGLPIYLTPKGLRAMEVFVEANTDAIDAAVKASKKAGTFDPFGLSKVGAGDLAEELARRELGEQMFVQSYKRLPKEFVDPSGIKLTVPFSDIETTIIPRSAIQSISIPLLTKLRKLPYAEPAIQSAANFGTGVASTLRSVFHPFGKLANLPPELKEQAMRLSSRFVGASSVHRTYFMKILEEGSDELAIAPGMLKRWRDELRKDPDLGRKLYDSRELTGRWRAQDLTNNQRQLFQEFNVLFDRMGDTLYDMGIIKGRLGNYYYHRFLNIDDLDQYHMNAGGTYSGDLSTSFTKHRGFQTYEETVEYSKRMNKQARQSAAQENVTQYYPELIPNYNVMENLVEYIDKYADVVARKGWYEEAAARFGRRIADHDPHIYYEISKPWNLRGAKGKRDKTRIRKWFGRNQKTIREIEKEFRTRIRGPEKVEEVVTSKGGKIRTIVESQRRRFTEAGKGAGIPAMVQQFRRLLDQLETANGKREALRQLIERSNSGAQGFAVMDAAWDKYAKYLPEVRGAVQEGVADSDVLKALYGDSARRVPRSGSHWGAGVMIPKIIAEDIENVRGSLVNTKQWGEFQKMLKGWDFMNNMFKTFAYALWPASAIRDLYSNVFLSGLDIGLGAIDPKMHRATIGILAGREGVLRTNTGRVVGTYEQLGRWAKALRVWVPGKEFAERTGREGAERLASARGPSKIKVAQEKLFEARGLIDNESRVQHWINNLRRGLSPEQAAEHTHKFLFDYGRLNPYERHVIRRLIPFSTFTLRNIRLQVGQLRRHPGRQINQLKPFRGREDENEAMVKWEAEGLKMVMQRDGKTVRMVTGIDLPMRNIDVLWRGTMGESVRGLFGMVTPLLKTPVEAMTGIDLFLSKDLTRTESHTMGRVIERMPKTVRDWMGWRKHVDDSGKSRYTFDGRKFNLVFRSWILSRALSTSDRQFREYLTDVGFDGQASTLDFLTGLRHKQIDLNEQQRRTLIRRIRQIEESLRRRGRRAVFETTFTPKDKGEF